MIDIENVPGALAQVAAPVDTSEAHFQYSNLARRQPIQVQASVRDLDGNRTDVVTDMTNVAARTAGPDVIERLRSLVDHMDQLLGDAQAYADQDRAFHDLIMQTSGNRLGRARLLPPRRG